MKENRKDNSDKEDVLPTASRLTPEEESIFTAPPPKVKGYHIISALGEGGFGIVYLAEQQKPVKRRVALKVLKPGMDSKQVIARFEAEEQALALLDHPNVAQVYEASMTEGGRSYFAMEYVKGVPITEHCDRNKLIIEDRLKLFLQVCDAIGHAHQKGIIHRDIKPSNILVSIHGEKVVPKVIDFGVAKAISQPLTERTLFTEQGQLIGTPEYMSPEQAEMTAQDIDTRTDIYSLGVLLYELLTGVLPFDPKTLRKEAFGEIQRIIREQDPPRPSTRLSSLGEEAEEVANSRRTEVGTLVKRLHKELEWIPLKAMRKERMHRYRSASELADDVQNYLKGAPLMAGPESAAYRVKKFVRRNRALVTGVAAVLVVLLAGIVVSTILAIEQARARVEADKARKTAEAARISEIKQRQIAEAEANRAKEASEARRHTLYFHSIALAEASYREGNISRVRELLESCPNDLRGWEWHYINHISDQSIMTIKRASDRYGPAIFSPDGKCIVSGCTDGSIKVWEAASGTQIETFAGHKGRVNSLAFSPDGKRLASGSWDKTIKLWDADTGAELITLGGHDENVMYVTFGPEGKRIASTAYGKTSRIWDSITGEELMTLRGDGDFWSIAFSPDGKYIASSSETDVKIWDANNGDEVLTISGAHKDWVTCVAYSPDGKRIASCGGWDTKIKIWDTSNGAEVLTIVSHQREALHSVTFSQDGKRILSAGRDSIIKVWDALTGDEVMALHGHEDDAPLATFSPDGSRIVSCGFRGTVKVWSTILEGEHMELRGHKDEVFSVAFGPDGKRLASSSSDGTVKIWDIESGAELMTLSGHGSRVGSVAFSNDGKRIASSCADGTIKVWDATIGTELLSFHGHDDSTNAIAFSPDGKYIASGGGEKDTTVKVWDALTGVKIATLRGHTGHIDSVAFSPDGKRIVSGGCCDIDGNSDGTARIWDIDSGAELAACKHVYGVFSVAFSRDGKYIASGGSDGDRSIKIWDANSGAEVITFYGHDRGVGSVAFSPDGKRFLSGSKDETIKLWDIETGTQVMTFPAQKAVWSAAFSPDGTAIAMSGGNVVTLFESTLPDGGYRPRETAEVARRVVDKLYEQHGFYYDVIDKLRVHETLNAPVCEVALQIANARRWEDAEKLNRESWEVVSLPDKSIEDYQLALEKAGKAKGFEPNNRSILNTFGVAKYRVGAYQDSLVTLTNSDKMRVDANQAPDPVNAAFTMMALHQLGRAEDAQVALERLRSLFENKELADDKNAQGFLIEAEKLSAGENKQLYSAWEFIKAGKMEESAQLIEEILSLSGPEDTKTALQIKGATKWLGRAYYTRGKNYGAEYAKAVADYETAVRIDPGHAKAFNELAWLRVMSPVAELRDAARAVGEATKACELESWRNHGYISTLAAAYAEVGDFNNAIKWQKAAIGLLPEEDCIEWQNNYKARLRLYESNSPYNKGYPWSFSAGELVASWRFDEIEEGKVIDSSGNGLDGKLVGGASIVRDVERGNVLSLDGDGDYLDCGNDSAFDISGSITVAAWIKIKAFDKDSQAIISKGNTAWRISRYWDRKKVSFNCSGLQTRLDWSPSLFGIANVNDGKWHHVIGVYDGIKMYLYVDGELDASESACGSISANSEPVFIGENSEGRGCYWNGLIDDVCIYSYALSEVEVKAFYAGKEPALRKE